MKNRAIFIIILMSIRSALSWGQIWPLSETMTAVLVDNVMTISTTLEAEDMPWRTWSDDDRNLIHSLVIEDGVTSICEWAFAHHANLASVTMANSVTIIDSYGFYNCGSLQMIKLSEGLTTLKQAAFKLCGSLTEVEIPASVSFIMGELFVECSQLEVIHVHEDNTAYSSYDGVLYDKDRKTLLIYPEGKSDVTFEMPATVEKIYESAFNNSRFEAISIPNSVTEISRNAFCYSAGLTSVTIPESVEEIGIGAFVACGKLTSIGVDARNKIYASDAGLLYNRDKTLLHTYPAGRSDDFTVPSFVKAIGPQAFAGGLIPSVTIPNTVKTMGDGLFLLCKNLKSAKFSNGLTEIPNNAFYNCFSLTTVELPRSITTIGGDAFNACFDLASITLPFSVTEIGEKAFKECTGLKELTVEWETPLSVPVNVFEQVNTSDITLFVPDGTEALYQEADVWKDFGTIEKYEFTSNASPLAMRGVKVWSQNGVLYITGLTPGKPLYIYNLAGQLVYSGLVKTEEARIPLAWRGPSIVVSGEQSVKVNVTH